MSQIKLLEQFNNIDTPIF